MITNQHHITSWNGLTYLFNENGLLNSHWCNDFLQINSHVTRLIGLHRRPVASLSAFGSKRYCFFRFVLPLPSSSLLLLASFHAFGCNRQERKDDETSFLEAPSSSHPVESTHFCIEIGWRNPDASEESKIFGYLQVHAVERVNWIEGVCFERQCRRANTQSGDITGSPADGCHFGTFDRRILFSELRFRTFAGDRILSTINLGIGIEPIKSRQGFFFSLKNANVTPGTPMFKKFLRPMPSSVKGVTLVQRTDDTSLLHCYANFSCKYTSPIFQTRQFALSTNGSRH